MPAWFLRPTLAQFGLLSERKVALGRAESKPSQLQLAGVGGE